MGVFSGIWIPLVTPFAHGTVDHDALNRLVKRYADAGVSGLVALGTTGEPASLSESEQDEVLATILGAAAGLPIVAGVAGNSLARSTERVEYLSETPVAGILVSPPYYIRPSQAGIVDYLMQLADTSTKPIVLYEIPYRTGVRIEIETLLTLAAHPRIQAIKDCAGSLETTLALIGDGRLHVLAGDDINIFTTLCLGGSGGILATAHIRPELFVAMYHAVADCRLEEGRKIFHKLVPIIQALFAEANPGPLKAALALEGLIHDELRAPMTRATEIFRKRWRQLSIG